MAVRCAHCGEELLGAVNRCWKCGKQFIARPTVEGLPPVRMEAHEASAEPLEAVVLEDLPAGDEIGSPPIANLEAAIATSTATTTDVSTPRRAAPTALGPPPSLAPSRPAPQTTFSYRSPALNRLPPPRPNLAALGGAVASLIVGAFGVVLAPFRYEAAIIGLIGLMMGVWGVYSPRRGVALLGMLLCCIAIGLGTFTGIRSVYNQMLRNSPIMVEEPVEE